MEFKNHASISAHEWLEFIADHVLVEFWHVEFFIPLLVQLLGSNPFCKLDVLEAFELIVLRKLTFQQGAK